MKISIYLVCWMFLMVAPICGHVNIRLLPMQGSQARIMCTIVKHWLTNWYHKPYKNDVEFYGNGTLKASIPYQKCKPKVADFSFSCSEYQRILTIKNISHYANMTWYCKRENEKSPDVFVPALAAPACTVNTTIDHNVPVNNLSSDGSLTVAQGDSLTLNCSSEGGKLERGNNPRFIYSWQFYPRETREGEPEGESAESVTHGKFVKHNISRYDAGVFVCTAVYNSTCKGSDTVNVNVLYPPQINLTSTETEEGEVNISCLIIPGNPYNTTVQGWRYVVEGQVIEEHPVEVGGDLAIYLTKPSVLVDGEYVCYASNGVTGFHGSVNQTASTSIRSRVPPYPIISQDGAIQVNRDTLIGVSETVLSGNITNVSAYLREGINRTQLQLHNTTIDTVNKTLTISGRNVSRQAIRVTSLVNMAADRETGSANLSFHVCNEFGCVERVYRVVFTESDRNRFTAEAWKSYLPYAIGGACILLVTVAMVFFICQRKRSKNISHNSDTCRYTNQTFDPSSVQEIYLSVVDKTKPPEEEVLENENYVSGDDRQVEEICYSVVNKTKPPEEEEMGNNIYVNTGTAENTQSKIEVLENETYVSGDDRQVEEIVENEFYVSGD